MENPFDDDSAEFVVLINGERQHSLWPARLAVPSGWDVAHGEDSRGNCLEFINTSWTDMRPAGLVAAMAETAD
ncbi:MAG TPA: MbtH family NRPS accessory protein [Actinocrinis sp.]|nr:MbtH family NRPS accessory protein [Actinocrinis sp.]